MERGVQTNVMIRAIRICDDNPEPSRVPVSFSASQPIRRGLAPVEMLLGLPLVLLLFALLINAGFTGMWQLRSLGAAREAAWRNRDQRTAMDSAAYHNNFWRQPSNVTNKGFSGDESSAIERSEKRLTTSLKLCDKPLEIPGQVSAESVRHHFMSLKVDADLLDPRKDAYHNDASLSRFFPLLRNGLQMMQINPNHALIAHTLPYWETNLPCLNCRRTKVLYEPDVSPGNAQRQKPPIETDIPGPNLPSLSGSIVHPSELGFQRFLSTASDYHRALGSTNLLPLAGHNVTPSLLDGIEATLRLTENMQRYHDPERYDWVYRGNYLNDGYDWAGTVAEYRNHWCERKNMPDPPGFMPTIFEIVSDNQADWNKLISPLVDKVTDDPNRLCEDPENPDPGGTLHYHLAGSYRSFYRTAIGVVACHVNHLQSIIKNGNDYLALPIAQRNPLMTRNHTMAMSDAKIFLGPAMKELERRKRILEPVIDSLDAYQRGF